MEPQGRKRLATSDVVVTVLARLFSKLLPVILIATILLICLAVYGIAWFLQNRS